MPGSKQVKSRYRGKRYGLRSDAGTVDFDWGIRVSDTSLPKQPQHFEQFLDQSDLLQASHRADGSRGY